MTDDRLISAPAALLIMAGVSSEKHSAALTEGVNDLCSANCPGPIQTAPYLVMAQQELCLHVSRLSQTTPPVPDVNALASALRGVSSLKERDCTIDAWLADEMRRHNIPQTLRLPPRKRDQGVPAAAP